MRKLTWRKGEIRTLCNQVAHWWTFNAMYLRTGVTREQVFATMPLSVRIGIVVGGLRGFQSMAGDRAQRSREMADHYRGCWPDTGQPRDPDGSFAAKCLESAADDDAAALACQRLIDRVESEGLPPEVVAFVPER